MICALIQKSLPFQPNRKNLFKNERSKFEIRTTKLIIGYVEVNNICRMNLIL